MGLHFSKEEFASRKSKVLKSMKEQNIDALLMFRQESMYWPIHRFLPKLK